MALNKEINADFFIFFATAYYKSAALPTELYRRKYEAYQRFLEPDILIIGDLTYLLEKLCSKK